MGGTQGCGCLASFLPGSQRGYKAGRTFTDLVASPCLSMDLYDSDVLTDIITYISRLSVDGIDSLQSYAHNKDELLSDEELAMAIFAEEAEGLLNIAKDRVERSSSPDLSIVQELEEMEIAARYDRMVAIAISEGGPLPPRPSVRARITLTPPDLDGHARSSSPSAASDEEE